VHANDALLSIGHARAPRSLRVRRTLQFYGNDRWHVTYREECG
jgi:hypothetical protein